MSIGARGFEPPTSRSRRVESSLAEKRRDPFAGNILRRAAVICNPTQIIAFHHEETRYKGSKTVQDGTRSRLPPAPWPAPPPDQSSGSSPFRPPPAPHA